MARLAATSAESVLPYYDSWKMVVAWAVAHDAVDQLLPMPQMTLKALTQELLMV
jgi:hypothetical protein